MKALRAFTLVEMLVVIGIVGLLAALLLPVLGRAKTQAHAATCRNNLRQWGLATQLYATEYNDFLVPEGFENPTSMSQLTNGWYFYLPEMIKIPPYCETRWRTNADIDVGKSIWICPSNPRRSNGNNLFHYCFNGLIDGTGADNHRVRLAAIRNPPRIVLFFDSKNLPAVQTHTSNPGNYVHTNLHTGGAQFVFLDGHVARFRNKEYWDFAAGKGITNNPALVWIP